MLKAIRDGLIRIAVAIGRWIIRRFATWVVDKITHYMQARLDDWRARPKARQPKGRIRRWQRALDWLLARKAKLRRIVSTEYDALADELEKRGIPESVAA